MNLNKDDIVYYARVMPSVGVYDIHKLKVRTVEDTWFVATEEKGVAFIFSNSDLGKRVFKDRNIALQVVKEAEKNKTKISDEIYYEEY